MLFSPFPGHHWWACFSYIRDIWLWPVFKSFFPVSCSKYWSFDRSICLSIYTHTHTNLCHLRIVIYFLVLGIGCHILMWSNSLSSSSRGFLSSFFFRAGSPLICEPVFIYTSSFLLQMNCWSWHLFWAVTGSCIIWNIQIVIPVTQQPQNWGIYFFNRQ